MNAPARRPEPADTLTTSLPRLTIPQFVRLSQDIHIRASKIEGDSLVMLPSRFTVEEYWQHAALTLFLERQVPFAAQIAAIMKGGGR